MIDTPAPVTTPPTVDDDQALRSQLTAQISAQLCETLDGPIYTIRLALKLLGHARILQLVEETLHIEQNGGMLTADGKRRRTLGGVFFKLLKRACTKEQHELLFPPDERPKRPYTKRAAKKKA